MSEWTEWVDAQEHGYGDTTHCKCGRNFNKARGLREHLTKQRRIVAERARKNQQVSGETAMRADNYAAVK